MTRVPEAGEVFAGRFRLERRLGRGGFATVFEAHDQTDGATVALKILHPEPDPGLARDLQRRFEREVDALSKLRSPHTVRLIDHGDDGLLWAAFELIPGIDLAGVLATHGRLRTADARHVLVQVLESLREAHQAGLVHRDLKPENVIVFDGARGPFTVKVLDFGIARSTDGGHPSVTRTGELIGTPRYMSPEQLRAQPLGPATDIYSLGLMGFELIAGRNALPGGALGNQLERLLPTFKVEVEGRGPEDLAFLQVLERMVVVDVNARMASADAVLHALAPRAGRPVSSDPVAHRWPWLAAILVVLGALAAGVALTTQDEPPRSAPVVRSDSRENPLLAPERPAAPANAVQPQCLEGTPGLWMRDRTHDARVFQPDGLRHESAAMVLVFADEPERDVGGAFGLEDLADRTNAIVVVPAYPSGSWDEEEVERAWGEVQQTRKDRCVRPDAPTIVVGLRNPGQRAVKRLADTRPADVAGAVMIGAHTLAAPTGALGSEPTSKNWAGALSLLDISMVTNRGTRKKSGGQEFSSTDERWAVLREQHGCTDGPVERHDSGQRICETRACGEPLWLCWVERGQKPLSDPMISYVAEMIQRRGGASQ